MTNQRSWFSNNLQREVNASVSGHYGFCLLLFPTFTDSHEENEQNGLLASISSLIKHGFCRVFCIEGIMNQSWLSNSITDAEKSDLHFRYNKFIEEEVVQFIFTECSGPVPIMTCGASFGGFLAANSYFRRPDIFLGTIAMSSTFNIQHFSKDFFDENCYFNSPIHYLPNLTDYYWMSFLVSKRHVYLASGSGENEFPENTHHLSHLLNSKGINHKTDIWNNSWGHNYETWKKMLPNILKSSI
ncbi:MAG: esterase [Candidatus Kapabacteria bacterium]|nr:esterase [Candidatus Kapabacteria bacterium]